MESYLTFQLDAESFALSVHNVVNILEMYKITKVPQMPDYVKGVINLRGEVLPVIDTRLKFGMSEIEITKSTCILVLEVKAEGNQLKVGALVDAVSAVIELDESVIQSRPSIGVKYESEFIIGMIENKDKFNMLVDINKIFSEEEIINLKEAKNTKN